MKYSGKVRTVTNYIRDIDKNKICFDHRVQRKAGQWSKEQKAEFIKTLLEETLAVPPISFSIQEDKYWVIDGKQRLLAINEYLKNEFALPKGMIVDDEGKKVDVGGCKYDKLPLDLRGKIFDTEIPSIEYAECSYEDEVRIFNVLNNGTPLSKAQKMRGMIKPDVLDKMDDIMNSDLFKKIPISKSSIKKGDDIVILLQTAMLLDKNADNEFLIGKVMKYKDGVTVSTFDGFKEAFDKLSDEIDDKVSSKGAFKRVNIPMILAGAISSADMEKYYENLKEFDKGYDKNKDYKKFLVEGTSRPENVTGRYDYFKKKIIA